jgi:hypothetical protein
MPQKMRMAMVRVGGAYVSMENSFVNLVECAIQCGQDYVEDTWPDREPNNPETTRQAAKNIIKAYLEQF